MSASSESCERLALTVRLFGRSGEIMHNVETLGLCVLCVRVGAVRDNDLLVWDARVTEVLGLCGTLVAESV